MTGPLQTFEDLTAAVKELQAYKAEAEKKISHAEAEAKEAKQKLAEAAKMAEEVKNKDKDMGASTKYPKTMRALKAASETTDEEDKKNHLAEAIANYKSEKDEEEKKEKEAATKSGIGPNQFSLEDQKKTHEAMAELKILRAEVVKPRIAQLNASFKGRVSEEKLKEYQAQWSEMSVQQLDAEIERITPFVGSAIKHASAEPLGYSTFETYKASNADTFSAEMEKKTVQELFS